jgi:predicted nucleic acid-binding protein
VILVDTSVWIDHFRRADADLAALLEEGRVLIHPFVIGEIALGNLRRRGPILSLLHDLPRAARADDAEVLGFIERHGLHGIGVGLVDANLLASVSLAAPARIWTRDKRLKAVADRLGLLAPGRN